jgi:DNA-binding CsgD family transcriptional regulator
MLLGRTHERQQIDQALAGARSGTSATLALVGEPGIGKTVLLSYAAERATGMQLLRARGIESEAQIPFGSLLELIRPALMMLDKIPAPQAAALEGALALRPGAGHDRFAVGAATLSLLAAYADLAPVAVLVDDAQWLDGSSAQALLFAIRRLVADPIAVLVAVRAGEPSLLDGADLPVLRIGGLTSDEAAMLVPGLAPEAARRLHGATAGNPLALLELAPDAPDMALAPDGAPVLVSARISGAFLRRADLLDQATQRALVLSATSDPVTSVEIDQLTGHIATRCGPVMRGHAILTAAAERADPERAVAMLAEAALACFFAGNPVEMLSVAARAQSVLAADPSPRARFLAGMTAGMARIIGGDAAAGAEAMHEAVTLAERSADLRGDLQLIPWLALGPLFLRQTGAGRPLLEHALRTARAHAAVGALPFVLNLIARDQAATDHWAVAGATYQEAIALARESGQQAQLAFGLAGFAWLQARRGREQECRAGAAEALSHCRELGIRLYEIWATAALGELELGLGNAAKAAGHFEHQQQLLRECGITDVDLWPAAELTDAYTRLGLDDQAQQEAAEYLAAASAKSQPWSLARALRCRGLLAAETGFSGYFEQALRLHQQTPDAFEAARTRLAYGERLRRARNRILAREQLRAAADAFERLDARPWADRARAELAATGETRRRRDPSTIDELTPQELQIALLLTAGKTTRETAAALFLSPKTVEYHLRHVYQKLGIHSRDELAQTLATQTLQQSEQASPRSART